MLEVLLYVAVFLGAMWGLLMIAAGAVALYVAIKAFREFDNRPKRIGKARITSWPKDKRGTRR